MGITAVVLFFVYLWGLGFTAERLLKAKTASFPERQVMRTGLGMSVLVLLAMVLNIANVPLDWRIFLAASVAYPIYYAARNFRKMQEGAKQLKLKVRLSDINIIAVAAIFAASMYMYASGAFSYPYLENDDPWSHASGVKYLAIEKTFDQSENRLFQYMNPYPPSYDFVLALANQVEPSLYWVMKFFNALIISLSLVYFYFFAKEFSGNRNKALMATLVLAAVPAYLSHFIWAPALAMAMFFPAMYALEMIKHDRKWKWMAAIALGGLLVAHPTHTLTLFALAAIYAMVKVFATKDLKSYASATIGGIIASLAWWGPHGKAFFGGNIYGGLVEEAVEKHSNTLYEKILNGFLNAFSKWSGTASRPYTFNDFFVAKGQNLINNPVGIGVAVTMLFVIGLVATPIVGIKRLSTEKKLGMTALAVAIFGSVALFSNSSTMIMLAVYAALMLLLMIITKEWKQNTYFFITLAWFLLTFLIVNNQTFDLPIGFYAFRTWMIMAVPVALIAAEGVWGLFNVMQAAGLNKQAMAAAKIALIALVLAGIWMTSASQKQEVNTANWPPGAFWTSYDEVNAYVWLRTLPTGTKVWSYLTDDQVIGMDKYSCGWCKAEAAYRKTGFNDTAVQTAEWMENNRYDYVIIGGREARQLGQEQTMAKLTDLASSGLFTVAYQTNGAVVLRRV